MISKNATIQNERGIHLRPSGIIAAAIREYPGTVVIEKDDHRQYEITSPLSILALGLTPFSNIIIHVTGPNEEEFCDRLVALFSKHFEFT